MNKHDNSMPDVGRAGFLRRSFASRRSLCAKAWWIMASITIFAAVLLASGGAVRAADTSAPAYVQWFESSWNTMEQRTPDLFKAGYGAVWVPPTGRADQGNLSVGYDPYDRFDLGSAGNPTLYGTETGLKATINSFHRAGVDAYADVVWNHNGYSTLASSGFYDAGGYPGLNITLPDHVDGDFHGAFDYGDVNGRLAGLIDIDHSTNYLMVRNPVPGQFNIRAGTTPAFGRLANVPSESNRRFYPDQSLNPISVYDPLTNEANIKIYPFNLGNPLNGTPVQENATGYLMRNSQWLVESIGFDGFRIDAAKHFPGYVLDYFDRAIYRSSFRGLLDGSQKQIFSFSEVYDGNQAYLQTFVKKTINPSNPGVIGGNRDTLDFPLYFALRDNLTGNGFNNNWNNIRNASLDLNDDGLHNGSQGMMFVQSHDNFGPDLGNVAYAYVLMHPGNAIVYFNAKEFGNGRQFPKDGRGDAMGGVYGNAITTLLDIRNTHGRGNYIERWIEKENFAYERDNSAIVMMSNRTDAGYDSRTLLTNFAAGTPLIELTGNATSSSVDPRGDIPGLVVVNNDHTINVRFLRNSSFDTNNNSFFHGNGYLVYGLSGPQGNVGVANVAQTLAGATPSTANNGTARLTDVSVIRNNTFNVTLNTNAVNLLGVVRDRPADGDNALIKIDEGLDLNGNGHVDYVTPGAVNYGFEEFGTSRSPGFLNANGNGQYVQAINTANLSDGYHYITVRAFRHRDDGGPAIFTDFKQVIYVDRNQPNSGVDSFTPITVGVNENRDLTIRSLDQTADSVHVFLDLPGNLTGVQILAMVNSSNQAGATDRDLFKFGFFGLKNGNHAVTIVTYRPTGTYNIQRIGGLATQTLNGAGLGDINFDGVVNAADIANVPNAFEAILYSQNAQFNPAADINGDGFINTYDLLGLRSTLTNGGANQAALDTYQQMFVRRGDLNGNGVLDYGDMLTLRANFGSTSWTYDLNGDGIVDSADAALLTSGFSVVPEPSTFVLATMGLLGLLLKRRRKRAI